VVENNGDIMPYEKPNTKTSKELRLKLIQESMRNGNANEDIAALLERMNF
jgi:hypothetical protein